ncbi:hypothetical protein ACFWVF_09225 [Streptomyces sp. NPDC058659]|uniref:hypothetical protein n=1 Tax=unclassified Streptomyces TaxID=2593676 RepID=UPI00366A4DA8
MSTHDDDRNGPGPAAPDATTAEALGSLSKALETVERTAVPALAGGHEHRFEARLQRERRTPGHSGRAPAEGADA